MLSPLQFHQETNRWGTLCLGVSVYVCTYSVREVLQHVGGQQQVL